MRLGYLAASLFMALAYRILLFTNASRASFPTEVLVRKFTSGFLYDLIYICATFLIIEVLYQLSKSRKVYLWASFSFLTLIGMANIANVYTTHYVPDGIANWSMIWAYLDSFNVLVKTGAGLSGALPFLGLICLLGLYLWMSSQSNIKRTPLYKTLIPILFLGIASNQTAKEIRVDKYGVLEDNALIRLFKAQNTERHLSNILALGERKIPDSDLELIRDSESTYPSKDFPLLNKKDKLKSLNFINKTPNIVLIILESVSYDDVFENIEGKDHSIAPFLQNLASQGHNFSRFYSHSGYTAGGQLSLLCSIYDNIRADDPELSIMRDLYGINLHCLPEILKKQGYKTSFFNGYTESFDNKDFFFPKIGIDHLFCRERIQRETSRKIPTRAWGINDGEVLPFMKKKLKTYNEPFFSIFMSVNTHPPYDMIDDTLPLHGNTPRQKSVSTTDAQLKIFFESIRDESWFENTLFIVTADNGNSKKREEGQKSEQEYFTNLHHIPFFLYHPSGNLPQKEDSHIAGQIDLAPTILHLLGKTQETTHFLGESLYEKDRRKYVYTYRYFSHHNFISQEGIYDAKEDKILGARDFHVPKNKLRARKNVSAQLLFNDKIWPGEEQLTQ